MNIRASSLGSILGLSPWATPLQVWRRLRGLEPEQPDSPSMAEGRAMEAVILAEWAKESDGDVSDQQKQVEVPLPHATIIGHIDGIGTVGDRRFLLEAKWSSRGLSDAARACYWVQVQAYLEGLGMDEALLLVREPGQRAVAEPIRRDPAGWAVVYAAVCEWHERHIVGGEPPEPTGADERRAVALSRLRDAGAVLRPDEALDRQIQGLLEARDAAKALEARIAESEAVILEAMASAGAIRIESESGWSATVVERPGSVRWKDVAEALGAGPRQDLVEQHRGAPARYLRWGKGGRK